MREIFTVIDHNDEDNRYRIDGDELAERMADKQHENLERVLKFRDRGSKREYEVPESELADFQRLSQGRDIEPVRRIAMYDGREKRDGKDSIIDFADDQAARHFEVPESELEDFGQFADATSWRQADRDETKRLVSSRGYQPESPFVAGMRKFGEQAAVTGKRLGAEAGIGILQGAAKIGALGGTVANAVSPGSGDKLIDANDVMGQIHEDAAAAFQPEESGNVIAGKAQQMAFGAVNSIGQQVGARAVTFGVGGGLTGKAAETVRGALVAGSYGNERGIEVYRQAKAAGKSDAAALGLAGVGAVVETGLEYVGQMFGGGKAAKEAMEGVRTLVGETIAKHIGKEIAEEAATEFAQEYLGHLIDEIAKSPDKWHKVIADGQVQKDALEAGVTAAGSAVMSVGTMQGPNAVSSMVAERKAADFDAGTRTVEHGGRVKYNKDSAEGAKAALATDKGLDSWIMHHNEAAQELSTKDAISRKDIDNANLPHMSEDERADFLERLKNRMKGRDAKGGALEGRKSAEELAEEENGDRVSKTETADQLKIIAQRAEEEAQSHPTKENIDFANESRRDLYVYEALQQRSEKSGRLKGTVPSIVMDDGQVFGALDKVEPGAYQKGGETIIVTTPGQTAAEAFTPGLREDVEARMAAREQNAMKVADEQAEVERHREREKDIEAAFAEEEAQKASARAEKEQAEKEVAAQRERRETDEAQARKGERVQKVLDKFDNDMDAAALADEDGFVNRNSALFGEFQQAVESNNPGKAEEVANKLRKRLRAERKGEAPERRAKRAEESAAEEKARREERRQRAWEIVRQQQAEYNEARAREKAEEAAREEAERKAREEQAAKDEAVRKEAEALEQQRKRREADAEGQEKGRRVQKILDSYNEAEDAANLVDREGFIKRNQETLAKLERGIRENNPGLVKEATDILRKRLLSEKKNPRVAAPVEEAAAPTETNGDGKEQRPVEQGTEQPVEPAKPTQPEKVEPPASVAPKAEDYDTPEAKTKWMDDNPDAAKAIIRDAQKHGGVPGAGVLKKAGLPDMTRDQRIAFGQHLREEAERRREAAEKLERGVAEQTSITAYEADGHEAEAAAIGTGLPIDDKSLGDYLKALSAWRLAISHGGTKFSTPNGKTDYANGRNKPLYSQFAKGDTAVNDRISSMLDGMTADDIRKMRDAIGKGSGYSRGGTENLAATLAENLGGKDADAQMTNAEALDRIIQAWDSYQQWRAEREERIRKGEPVSEEEVHAREEEEEEQQSIQEEAAAIANENEGGDDSFDFALDGGTEEDAAAENEARRKGERPEKAAPQSEAVNIQPEWNLGQDQSDLFHPIEDTDAPFQRDTTTRKQRLDDPEFQAWAKKNGIIPTDGARERYDRQQARGAANVIKRWINGVKVRFMNNGPQTSKLTGDDRTMIVDDPDLVRELDADTVPRLRTMQLRDGKLYPPMAGKIKGQWVNPTEEGKWYRSDEHPDIAFLDKKTGKWKFKLNKGNGESVTALYNPYWHTTSSPLNDQFTSAYKRPELVTVETVVPRAEAEGRTGYKAEKAADAVGEKGWHSGTVSAQLKAAGLPERTVTLSRHNKVVRVVPTSEVADRIALQIKAAAAKGYEIEVPFNTLTPQLRDALVMRGVKIGEVAGLSGKAKADADAAYQTWKARQVQRAAHSVSEAGEVAKKAGVINKPLHNDALGIDAVVTGAGLSKMMSEKATKKSVSPRLHALAVANVDNLFESAYSKIDHSDTHGRGEVTQTHRLGSLMKDPESGRYVPILLTVLEYQQYGNRVYSIEAVDVVKYENSAGQLADSALPDTQAPIAEFVKSIASEAERVNNFSDPNVRNLYGNGGEIIGKYNRKTNEVSLYPGANAATVAHETGWHATYAYAEDMSKSTDPREAARGQKLLAKLKEFAQNAPQNLVAEVSLRYGIPSGDVLLDEVGAARFTEREAQKIKDEATRRAALKWYGKAWEACKDAYKSMLTKMGRNKVDLSAIDAMTPEQVVDFLADQMTQGKELGRRQSGEIDMEEKESSSDAWTRREKDYLVALKWLDDKINGLAGSRQSTLHRDARLVPGRKQKAVNEVNDFVQHIADKCNEAGVTLAELDEYLYARGAHERNRKIQARNGKLDGSAMPTDVAQDIIDRYENSSKGAALKSLQQEIMKFQDKGLQRRVDAGLISAEFAEKLRSEEPNHVPMKSRFDENGDFTGYDANASFSRPEWEKAKGRKNVGGAVLSWIAQEYLDAHARGAENDVRRQLVAAIAAHPEIGTVEQVFDNFKEHEVRQGKKNFLFINWGTPSGTPNLLMVRNGGNSFAIRLNGSHGELIARALTQRANLKMPEKIQQLMRFWASTATELSPTFGVRNVIGDNMSVFGINVGEHGIIKGTVENVRHVRRLATLLGTARHYAATGEVKGKYASLLQRYIDAGGLIGGMGNEGYGRGREGAEGGEAVERAFRSGKRDIKAVAKSLFGWVDTFNKTSEIMTRFADFVGQVESGMSDEDAALHAREVTVDFNQKGEATGYTNTFYMFSNSTLGATVRECKALGGKHGVELAGGLFALGIVEALVEHWRNPDDDDKEKEGVGVGKDVSEFTRANSLMTRVGDRIYRLPIHAGPFSFIKYAGNCMTRYALGDNDKTLKDASLDLARELAGIVWRFTGTGDLPPDLRMALWPTIVQPIWQSALNIDYKGSPLENRGFNDKAPKSHNGRDSTPSPYKMAAEWLNDTVGGGNEGKKGQIFGISTDVSPEMLKMWTEAVGKNLLRDMSNLIDVVNAIRKGEMPDIQNTPYARDYVRPVSNDTRFYEQTDERDKLETEFDRLIKAGKYDQAFEVVQKHPLAADEPAKGLRKMQSTIKEVRDMERHATKKGEKEEYRTIRRRLQAQYLEVVLGEKPLE